MRKLLLFLMGIVGSSGILFATDCPSAIAIPGAPTFPYSQSLSCGVGNDINSSNVTNICGSSLYYGGNEALYVWTPTHSYSGVSIAYSGVSWTGIMLYAGCPTSGGTCIGQVQGSGTSKTLSVAGTINMGTTYYIVFDTWPSPSNPCPGTFTINGTIIAPATPPTPVQDPGIPTCMTGTQLTVPGSPAAGVNWYWQGSNPNGTSTAQDYTTPYAVAANGTYYLRAYDMVSMDWSVASSSVVVSNFPVATSPPMFTPAANPACVTTGTTLSEVSAPAGYIYYWQGTTLNGSSTAFNASTPYSVSTTGTYYVAAYEIATGCWSNTVGSLVTVDTYIPAAPTTLQNNYSICTGTSSLFIDATPPPGGSGGTLNISFGTNLISTGSSPAIFSILVPAIPADATITSAQLQLTTVSAINGSWRNEIRVATSGIYNLSQTQISSLTGSGTITPDPSINLSGYPVGTSGALNLVLTESYDDAGVDDATFGEVKLVITYTQNPTSALSWYDSPTGGTQIGVVSPFETVGTSVMPNTSAAGTHTFYASATSGGCESASRTPITVNVAEVVAVLDPIDVTCNGFNDGSFSLGAIQCGTLPFTYSIDGGAFGPIPTNLTAGTYSIVIQDFVGGMSSPVSLIVSEPMEPQSLNVSGITYFNATLGWTAQGSETTWTIEYGPAGFTPGFGTTVTATTNPWTINGLTEATNYEFYVAAGCSPTSDVAGPYGFTTNSGFYTYDNNCGPGFIDISGTGTPLNLSDDASTTITSVFPLQYQGSSGSNITISNNGWIAFGSVTLDAWNLDLDDEEGNVYYETVVAGSDSLFIVEWYQRPRYATVLGQNVTFELIYNQTTHEIFYIYDDVVFGGSQSGNDYGGQGTISAYGPVTGLTISNYSTTYLTNNSCVRLYAALCPEITNLSSSIFQEDALLDWDPGLYGESSWTLIYGPEGFDPLAIPSLAIDTFYLSSSDANFGGTLTQLTTYDVYIYSECEADSLTSDGFFYSFTTLPWCSDPFALNASTVVDSVMTNWLWVESDPSYPVSGFNLQYGLNGFTLYTGTEVPANGTDFSDTIPDNSFLAGGVYELYIQAVCGADTSNYVGPISFVMPLTNDDACGAEIISVDGTVYTFNNDLATVAVGEDSIAPPNTGLQETTGWSNSTLNQTTWFSFIAPASGNIRINNTAIEYNGQVAVYDASDCAVFATYTLIGANDNEIGGTSTAPNFTICGLTPGDTYYLMHDGFDNTTGNYSLSISPIDLNAGSVLEIGNVCSGSNIDLFTTIIGYDAGGIWSSNISTVNANISGSDFTSVALAPMMFDFEYTLMDGCAVDSVISQVEVFATSNAGGDGTITACRNQPIDLLAGLTGSADLTGTWYDLSVLPGSSITTSNTAGVYNFIYVAGNGVCPDDSASVTLTVLGCDFLSIEDNIFDNVTVYPNPSHGTVFINSGSIESFDYEIMDTRGRIILTAKAVINDDHLTEINLNDVRAGMYFIRLTNTQTGKTFRIIIE